jgi:DNA-directed RNA polymerase specialized sigma subunit
MNQLLLEQKEIKESLLTFKKELEEKEKNLQIMTFQLELVNITSYKSASYR